MLQLTFKQKVSWSSGSMEKALSNYGDSVSAGMTDSIPNKQKLSWIVDARNYYEQAMRYQNSSMGLQWKEKSWMERKYANKIFCI